LAKTDDGEFELILGNRQLISIFLIIVILVGVFFAMGYIVGRNSAAPATAASNMQGGKQIAVEPASRKDTEQASTREPSPLEAPLSTAAPDTKPPGNPPAAEKKTAPVKREPVALPQSEKKTEPAPEKKREPPPERPPAVAVDQPSPGIYWQVAASPRAGADVVAAALRKKGMQVTLVPVPDKNLFRVLVGPYPDASAAATVRTQLEDAGLKGPIQKKF
jgi:outer membrane biosynthesis protein TonB